MELNPKKYIRKPFLKSIFWFLKTIVAWLSLTPEDLLFEFA